MGKYEAPRATAPGGKKHIGLWIALAILLILVIWGIWFFTTPPEQNNTVGNNNVNTNQTVQPDTNVQTPVDTQPEDSTQTPLDTPVDTQEPTKEMKKGWYSILLAGTMDGYNTDTLTVAAIPARDGYCYKVQITDQYGQVIFSDMAELTVN